MRVCSGHLLAIGGILALTLPAVAGRAAEARTPAAVRAADDAWGAAEVRGDAAFVERLLLPDYRSIGPAGLVTTKETIVEHTRARGASAAMAAEVAAWKATHPTRADVVIVGDTAVLTWVSTRPEAGEPVSSCDVFVYHDGRWRALYSQHSGASA